MDFAEFFKLDLLLQAYLILMVLDFVTGFLKAWKSEGFKSRKIRDGVIRVVGELIALFFVGILDVVTGLGVMLAGVKVLFVFKEGVSILENLEQIGVELPTFIKENLQSYRDKNMANSLPPKED